MKIWKAGQDLEALARDVGPQAGLQVVSTLRTCDLWDCGLEKQGMNAGMGDKVGLRFPNQAMDGAREERKWCLATETGFSKALGQGSSNPSGLRSS